MLRTKISMLSLAALMLCIGAVVAQAQATIQIDEKGHGIGTVGSGYLSNDPGPGGLNNVLTYNLPFTGVQGDVLITDDGLPGNQDWIRFNGNGTVIFYSDKGDTDPGDTGTPTALYTNNASVNEFGPEGNNSALYTPVAGGPGFNTAANPVSYKFVSDGNLFADTFQVNYFAGARGSRPDQTVRITNPGSVTGTPLPTSGTSNGNLCANIYVFSPDQQLAECCSCFVSPNGLRTLSVDFDLANNPLTPVTLGEGVIKIVSSDGPGFINFTTGVCFASSAQTTSLAATSYTPFGALRAWGTHNQDVSSPGSLSGAGVINQVTETHFLNATLSNAELNSLQSNCLFIQNQGSGHGKCTCGRGD